MVSKCARVCILSMCSCACARPRVRARSFSSVRADLRARADPRARAAPCSRICACVGASSGACACPCICACVCAFARERTPENAIAGVRARAKTLARSRCGGRSVGTRVLFWQRGTTIRITMNDFALKWSTESLAAWMVSGHGYVALFRHVLSKARTNCM